MLVALGRTESYAALEGEASGKVAWTLLNVHAVVFNRCPVDGAMLLKVVRARLKPFVAAAYTVDPSPITLSHFFEVTGLSPECPSCTGTSQFCSLILSWPSVPGSPRSGPSRSMSFPPSAHLGMPFPQHQRSYRIRRRCIFL